MTSPRPLELIEPDARLSKLANAIAQCMPELAGQHGLSPWDGAVALANACGHILASSRDMPREKALERMDSLRQIMEGAYELATTEGPKQ